MIDVFYMISSCVVVMAIILFMQKFITTGFSVLAGNQVYVFMLHLLFGNWFLLTVDLVLVAMFVAGAVKNRIDTKKGDVK